MRTKKRRKQPDVNKLLTGRFKTVINEDKKKVRVFEPQAENIYPSLSKLRNLFQDRFSEDQIQCHEGLRLKPLEIDRSVFSKTDAEKLALKEAKQNHRDSLRKAGIDPNTQLNLSPEQMMSTK